MGTLDTEAIGKAILAAPIVDSAKEPAAALCEAWIARFGPTDSQWRVVAAESPWWMWLTPKTLVVGMQDVIYADSQGIAGGEWKSKRPPRIRKDGQPYQGDTEQDWVRGLVNSAQCKIYALAMREGSYVKPVSVGDRAAMKAAPRIRVRAANKSTPPTLWPAEDDALFEYSAEMLDLVRDILTTKADSIRSMRRVHPDRPWGLSGIHCTNRFGRECEYLHHFCAEMKVPPYGSAKFDTNDPGWLAVKHADADLSDPELVIFSASSFESAQWCDERYHLLTTGTLEKQSDINLDIGTGMHTGLAVYYTQLMTKGEAK